MKEGEIKAVESGEEVVPASEVKALKAKIRDLERSLGRKTHELEVTKDILELAPKKNDHAFFVKSFCGRLCASGETQSNDAQYDEPGRDEL